MASAQLKIELFRLWSNVSLISFCFKLNLLGTCWPYAISIFNYWHYYICRYEYFYGLLRDFPDLRFTINGGIKTIDEVGFVILNFSLASQTWNSLHFNVHVGMSRCQLTFPRWPNSSIFFYIVTVFSCYEFFSVAIEVFEDLFSSFCRYSIQ